MTAGLVFKGAESDRCHTTGGVSALHAADIQSHMMYPEETFA